MRLLLSAGATWRLRDVDIPVSGWIKVNSPSAANAAAVGGRGFAHVPPSVSKQIVYVASRLLPTRAIVFRDFIAEVFSKIPALNTPASP
ncbi:MAG TPA: hypothetical protein VGE56_09265 [Rhodocyclaceae bacterium]